MKRVYIRKVDAGHGEQRLTVENGVFSRIETYCLGNGYYAEGSFVPTDFEEDKRMKKRLSKKIQLQATH